MTCDRRSANIQWVMSQQSAGRRTQNSRAERLIMGRLRPMLAVNADGAVELLKIIACSAYVQFVPCGDYSAEIASQFCGGLSVRT